MRNKDKPIKLSIMGKRGGIYIGFAKKQLRKLEARRKSLGIEIIDKHLSLENHVDIYLKCTPWFDIIQITGEALFNIILYSIQDYKQIGFRIDLENDSISAFEPNYDITHWKYSNTLMLQADPDTGGFMCPVYIYPDDTWEHGSILYYGYVPSTVYPPIFSHTFTDIKYQDAYGNWYSYDDYTIENLIDLTVWDYAGAEDPVYDPEPFLDRIRNYGIYSDTNVYMRDFFIYGIIFWYDGRTVLFGTPLQYRPASGGVTEKSWHADGVSHYWREDNINTAQPWASGRWSFKLKREEDGYDEDEVGQVATYDHMIFRNGDRYWFQYKADEGTWTYHSELLTSTHEYADADPGGFWHWQHHVEYNPLALLDLGKAVYFTTEYTRTQDTEGIGAGETGRISRPYESRTPTFFHCVNCPVPGSMTPYEYYIEGYTVTAGDCYMPVNKSIIEIDFTYNYTLVFNDVTIDETEYTEESEEVTQQKLLPWNSTQDEYYFEFTDTMDWPLPFGSHWPCADGCWRIWPPGYSGPAVHTLGAPQISGDLEYLSLPDEVTGKILLRKRITEINSGEQLELMALDNRQYEETWFGIYKKTTIDYSNVEQWAQYFQLLMDNNDLSAYLTALKTVNGTYYGHFEAVNNDPTPLGGIWDEVDKHYYAPVDLDTDDYIKEEYFLIWRVNGGDLNTYKIGEMEDTKDFQWSTVGVYGQHTEFLYQCPTSGGLFFVYRIVNTRETTGNKLDATTVFIHNNYFVFSYRKNEFNTETLAWEYSSRIVGLVDIGTGNVVEYEVDNDLTDPINGYDCEHLAAVGAKIT